MVILREVSAYLVLKNALQIGDFVELSTKMSQHLQKHVPKLPEGPKNGHF